MQGSLSIEAALSLSLFLFLSFCLIMPMKMLDRQRQIQAVMESVGEELSQYAYVEYCFRTAEEGSAEVDVGRAEDTASSVLAAAYASARILGGINREWVEAVSFEGTDIGTDEMVHIVMRYSCHYLYNDLKAVDFGVVGELRNESGGRYSPCGTCGAGNGGTGSGSTGSGSTGSSGMGSGSTVYVMPYGTSFHLSKSCRSIIAYVQAVPLSQVEYLGECSYCIGK
nr:hypothetical protein [Enterocloster clostridioformis]